jgi:hypothetical protein
MLKETKDIYVLRYLKGLAKELPEIHLRLFIVMNASGLHQFRSNRQKLMMGIP